MRRLRIVCCLAVAAFVTGTVTGGAAADSPRDRGKFGAARSGETEGQGNASASTAQGNQENGSEGASGVAAASSQGSEASSAGKITICHATGSDSNPLVEITVSENATSGNGHGNHEDDIIPAPSGGCPGGDVGGADAGGGDNDNEKITICHATHSETNPYVLITISVNGLNGHENHEDDIIPAPASGECPATAGGEAPEDTGSAGTGSGGNGSGGTGGSGDEGVLGAGATGGDEATDAQTGSGVLGALVAGGTLMAEVVVDGELPFTGLPVWVVALIGVALAALGLWLRTRSKALPPLSFKRS